MFSSGSLLFSLCTVVVTVCAQSSPLSSGYSVALKDIAPFPPNINNTQFKYEGIVTQNQKKLNYTINGTLQYLANENGPLLYDISDMKLPKKGGSVTSHNYWLFNKTGILFFSVNQTGCQFFIVQPQCTAWNLIKTNNTDKDVMSVIKSQNFNTNSTYYHNCTIQAPLVALNQSNTSKSSSNSSINVTTTIKSIVELDNKQKVLRSYMIIYSNDTAVLSVKVNVIGQLAPITTSTIQLPVQKNCNVTVSYPPVVAGNSSNPKHDIFSILNAIINGSFPNSH